MNCAVCGDGPARPRLSKDGVTIHACPGCGLAFWRPPADFRPEALYDAGYFASAAQHRGYDDYAGLEASLRETFSRRFRRLPPPRTDGPRRLLDLGAAYGFAVDEARRTGWNAFGIEISLAAARRAAAVTTGRIAVADATRTPFAPGCFDVVTLWDVLEHLPDPHAAIAECARLLRPGGRVVLTTGDVGSLVARVSGARWHLYTLPEHLFFYTRRSLRILLESHGLRVEHVRAESSVYTLGYLVERLRKTLLRRERSRAASWPGARLRVPVNLFDVVTVTGVRTGEA